MTILDDAAKTTNSEANVLEYQEPFLYPGEQPARCTAPKRHCGREIGKDVAYIVRGGLQCGECAAKELAAEFRANRNSAARLASAVQVGLFPLNGVGQ